MSESKQEASREEKCPTCNMNAIKAQGYYCCTADFGEHEPTCKNYVGESAPPATETQPKEWSPAVKKAMKTFNDAWARRKAAEGATETQPDELLSTLDEITEALNIRMITELRDTILCLTVALREKEAELAHEKARHCIGGDIFEAGRNQLILNQQVELDYLQKIDRLEAELATAQTPRPL